MLLGELQAVDELRKVLIEIGYYERRINKWNYFPKESASDESVISCFTKYFATLSTFFLKMHFQRHVQCGVGLESHHRYPQERSMDNEIRSGVRDEDHGLEE